MPDPVTESSEATGNIAEFTVSELSFALKRSIEDAYGHVRVRGELGRISNPASGHVYLDLKDDKAVLSGVIWRGVAARLKIRPEQGLEVIATGKLTTYPGQSRYQIVIESLEPAGIGALMALLEERRKKLAAEGLFDEARKQLLPYLPRVIGVVTSPTGAVIRDILHRLADRFPVHVLVWPVRVQGDTCADEVAAAIKGFNALDENGPIPRPDLIIVARGGGSVEDLWGFNEESVVRAAAGSMIPLVSAVGHETDWTLIDHAADLRAPTPTGAAELAVPVRAELIASLTELSGRLRRSTARGVEQKQTALRALARGLPRLDDLFALPRQRLDTAQTRLPRALMRLVEHRRGGFDAGAARLARAGHSLLQVAQNRLTLAAGRLMPNALLRRVAEHARLMQAVWLRGTRAVANRLAQDLNRLDGQAKLLASLGYRNVLERGFVRVVAGSGKTISRAANTAQGDDVALEFYDGRVAAQITQAPQTRPGKRRRPNIKPKPKPGQGSLF
jgi:exodeoxyribonuclease VII large subunit